MVSAVLELRVLGLRVSFWDSPPLILTALNRDGSTPYYSPYEGLFVEGGTSQVSIAIHS